MGFTAGLEHVVRENEPLGPYTWFRLGGPAQYFAEPTSTDELIKLVTRAREEELPVRILGGGSNLLVSDSGVPGLTIQLSAAAFGAVEVQGQRIMAGGGAKLGHVISASVREGLAGLEQLVGIPGTVGGALHGNAGTDTGDIGRHARQATVLTRSGQLITREQADLRFSYRQSSLDELVILNATFELDGGDPEQLTKRMQKLWIVKKSTEPFSGENTGCIFKDPGGIKAVKLIEQAGLKGARVGQAEVSETNANFVVVGSGATASDVQQLIEMVEDGVADRTGVELERQIEIW